MPTQPFAPHYDVIVVGARCAGAAAGMLLARQGLRVLVVDRTRRGADTLSTHALMRPAILLLDRWGLLDAVRRAGTPPIETSTFHYGDDVVSIDIDPSPGVDALFAPRRTVLDPIVVDGAEVAGADVRFGASVQALLRAPNGRVRGVRLRLDDRTFEIGADLVIGADGMRSTVSQQVEAPITAEGSYASCTVYAYYEGLRRPGYHWHYRPGVAAGTIVTNDGQTCVFVAAPSRRFREELRHDLRGGFSRVLAEAAPDLAAEVRPLRMRGSLHAHPGRVSHLRRCHGPGWALLGDAGYYKDPLTAHGITDALRDAELLARAIARFGLDDLTSYERERDDLSLEFLHATDRIASFRWDLGEVARLTRITGRATKRELVFLESLPPPFRSSSLPFETAALTATEMP
jgi:menaquinone-9 beta-reductase